MDYHEPVCSSLWRRPHCTWTQKTPTLLHAVLVQIRCPQWHHLKCTHWTTDCHLLARLLLLWMIHAMLIAYCLLFCWCSHCKIATNPFKHPLYLFLHTLCHTIFHLWKQVKGKLSRVDSWHNPQWPGTNDTVTMPLLAMFSQIYYWWRQYCCGVVILKATILTSILQKVLWQYFIKEKDSSTQRNLPLWQPISETKNKWKLKKGNNDNHPRVQQKEKDNQLKGGGVTEW